MNVYLNGQFLPLSEARISPFGHSEYAGNPRFLMRQMSERFCVCRENVTRHSYA